jgi:hypothetical protein
MLRKLSPLAILLPLIACSLFGMPPEVPQPPIEDLPDIQLFSSDDCLTSCWQGLRPGETDSAQVIQLLSNPPFTFRKTSGDYENATVIFVDHEDRYSVEAVITDDRLHSVGIGALWLGLTLGDIIDVLGEPDYVWIYADFGSEIHVLELQMTLYYPNRGFAFNLPASDGLVGREQPEGAEVCVSADALVSGVTVTQTGSIEDMFEYLEYYRQTNVTPDQLGAWSGFGCIIVP